VSEECRYGCVRGVEEWDEGEGGGGDEEKEREEGILNVIRCKTNITFIIFACG